MRLFGVEIVRAGAMLPVQDRWQQLLACSQFSKSTLIYWGELNSGTKLSASDFDLFYDAGWRPWAFIPNKGIVFLLAPQRKPTDPPPLPPKPVQA